MTDFYRDTLRRKLSESGEMLGLLQSDRERGSLDAFRRDPTLYHAVCFRFVTIIEALLDIGQIILANKGKRATGEESIPALLAREKIVSEDLAARFRRMHGFRNRLVHAYGTLDDVKVAEYLAEHVGDIEELLAVFRDV